MQLYPYDNSGRQSVKHGGTSAGGLAESESDPATPAAAAAGGGRW